MNVFSDYKNDPNKFTTLHKQTENEAINDHMLKFFATNNISIQMVSLNPLTGVMNQVVAEGNIKDGTSTLRRESNIALVDVEFMVCVHQGASTKRVRFFKGQIIDRPQDYFKLFEVMICLNETTTVLERYMYFWYILKEFVAPDIIIDSIKLSDIEKTSRVMQTNSQTSSRTSNTSIAHGVFNEIDNSVNAIVVTENENGIYFPKDPKDAIEHLKLSNPHLGYSVTGAILRDLEVLADDFDKMMSVGQRHTQIHSNKGMQTIEKLVWFYDSLGLLAPSVRFVIEGSNVVGGKTQRARKTKSVTMKKS
jgi:hypothetical protein